MRSGFSLSTISQLKSTIYFRPRASWYSFQRWPTRTGLVVGSGPIWNSDKHCGGQRLVRNSMDKYRCLHIPGMGLNLCRLSISAALALRSGYFSHSTYLPVSNSITSAFDLIFEHPGIRESRVKTVSNLDSPSPSLSLLRVQESHEFIRSRHPFCPRVRDNV